MLFWLLIVISSTTPSFVQADDNNFAICRKPGYFTRSVVRTHSVIKKFTYRKFNGRLGVEFKPVVEEYTNIEVATKTIEICCKGYTLLRGKCVPLCDRVCENSECTAPNICTCLDGYERFNNFRCIPHCEKCVHGLCSAPNICECYRGYEKSTNDICQPKCEPSCRNGVCSLPNICSCVPGYKLSVNSTNDCQPICDPPCDFVMNGSSCVAPDLCKCPEGYKSSSDLHECLPICSNCDNGECVAPEVCECWEDYEKNNNGTCAPVCEGSCENGYCSAPQECTCNSGYEFDEYNRCLPICENCQNGKCIAPEKCSCWNGYDEGENGTCVARCNQFCENGYCSSPETCTCYEGYQTNLTDPYLCHPICEGCENGDCLEPGNCSCWENYEWNSVTNNCEFIPTMKKNDPGELLNFNVTKLEDHCDSSCINGVCIEGECHCSSGYTAADVNRSECISDCEKSCVNGICNEDSICVCLEGHILINGTKCESICSVECVNGFCIDPDFCECWEGYILDYNQTTSNYCIPLCDNEEDGCINGSCATPDVCECFEGFELSSNNKFICVPKVPLSEAFSKHSNLWPLYFCLVALILASTGLAYYFLQKTFGKKGYNVDKKEKIKGAVKYNKDKENAAVI